MTASAILNDSTSASTESEAPIRTVVYAGRAIENCASDRVGLKGASIPAADLRWLKVLQQGLGHKPFLCEAVQGDVTVGLLPLAFVKSAIFGKFLVSLPYVNSAGVIATSDDVARGLIHRAIELADELDVRYLELRQQREISHPALKHKNESKVLMQLPLPQTTEQLWDSFKSKLRSQIRSGEKHNFEILWGGHERLNEFYSVFSRNMRDLGTPVYSRRLFSAALEQFGDKVELCVVRLGEAPVAAAILVHGPHGTEVPSASSLRQFNSTNANMVMYWHLLQRAIQRGQPLFDFGRSSADSNTYRFKKQWGAESHKSVWQYYVRRGSIGDMRPDNSRFTLAISAWRSLPVWLTRLVGPPIVRGIP